MRRAETYVCVEFFPVRVQVWQGSSHYAPAQGIPYEAYLCQTITGAMLLDESDNFLGKPLAHYTNFDVHFALVGPRMHEDGSWLRVGDNFLNQVQVEFTATKAVSQDEQMSSFQACLRVFFALELNAKAQPTRRVNLLRKLSIHLYFCTANDLVRASCLHKGLLKYQWSFMLFHLPATLDSLAFRRCLNLQLFKRGQNLLTSLLLLNSLSSFNRHNLIEFSS